MPSYDYTCWICGARDEAVLPISERRNEAPEHCGHLMKLAIMPAMVRSTFEPFRAVTGDRRIINNESERRAFMRDFNLAEIGNDPSMAPPPIDPDQQESARKAAIRDLLETEAAPTFDGA